MPPMEQNKANSANPNKQPFDVVLASASPRRRRLLKEAGVVFSVFEQKVDESLDADLQAHPDQAVQRLAERKAGAAVQDILASDYTGMVIVIGADTMVVCEGQIFGKPKNLEDGKRMLRALSGKTHQVHTGVSVWMVKAPQHENVSLGYRSFVDTTDVTFKTLSEEQIADYLRMGESFDKAGAYAIQGSGRFLVDHIDGFMDTVIGLPVKRLFEEFPDLDPSQR